MATKVLIGIQARSGSSRLPKKGMELIGGDTLMQRVITPCLTAARYMDRHKEIKIQCEVAVLVPVGDELIAELERRGHTYMEGPEDDVLCRYRMAIERFEPDYVVRITGDCPLMQSQTITIPTLAAVRGRFDYVSNVDERYRTAFDGSDCEVISSRLIQDTHFRATSSYDREHVTTMMRREPPEWAKVGFVCGYIDFSEMKLSVDTPEDLERVRKLYESAHEKYQRACLAFGKQNVIRQ